MRDHVTVETRIRVDIPWNQLDAALLSVPHWGQVAGGQGFLRHGPGGVTGRKRTYPYPESCPPYREHAAGIPLEDGQVLLMLGARNLGNNLGFVAYHADRQPRVLHLAEEPYDRQPYACLCWLEEDGRARLALETARFPDEGHIDLPWRKGARVRWAVSGQPILWDRRVPSLDELAGETYDLRHIFHLLDKEALAGTEEDKPLIRRDIAALDELTRIYVEGLRQGPAERGRRILAAAEEMGLVREEGYLHSSIGLRRDGVVLLMSHGRLEDLGRAQHAAGAERAIVLDNGGSCGYYLSSLGTTFFASSTYFRPFAIAVLGLRLRGQILEAPFRVVQRGAWDASEVCS